MRYFLLCGFFVLGIWTAAGFAAHPQGENCDLCHTMHGTEEYKLLTQEAINSGQIACFTCHAGNLETQAPDTFREYVTSASHHPLGTDQECLICHEMDDRHNDGRLDAWPELKLRDPDAEDSHVYQGAKINNFCLSCHDNSPVTLGDPPRTPIDLSSAYEFTGHGRIDINEPCSACHEHHVSLSKPHMIKDVINNFAVTGNDNTVCYACHSYTSDTYLGKDAYLSSEHGIQNKLCIDCHNPHGDNKDLCYLCHNEQYSAHYSTKRDKLCVDCHNPHQKDNLKMTREDEEKLCFLCHKELERQFGNTRDGVPGSYTHHKVDDEEYGGGRVECFDCHNPHTVTAFNIVSDPDNAAMPPRPFPEDAYRTQTDMYDDFCLSCHDGSRFTAKDIKAELNFSSGLESGFTDADKQNLHRLHKEQGFGCQNCHDAHSSQGTSGIKRGALLREEIKVESWDRQDNYDQGRASCSSSSSLGMRCHQ